MLYSQNIMEKTIRIDNADDSTLDFINIYDDEILVTGFNFYIDSSHFFFSVLDTNLNIIHYINLREIDSEIVSGDTDLIKTEDGGYLLNKQKYGREGIIIKFSKELGLEWKTYVPWDSYKFLEYNNIIETDSNFVLFGTVQIEDYSKKMSVDIISKTGELLEHNILYESEDGMEIGDIKVTDTGYLVSFGTFDMEAKDFGDIVLNVVEMDFNFNELKKYTGRGKGYGLNTDSSGNIYLLTNYSAAFCDIEPIIRHQARKIAADFSTEIWEEDFFYPPFAYNGNANPFIHNIARYMYPDPNGGYYIVGDLKGSQNNFNYYGHVSHVPSDYKAGMSMIHINEDGETQWKYFNTYDYMEPKGSRLLSSGNTITVGQGLVLDNGIWRETITMVKTPPVACDQDACFTKKTKPLPKYEIGTSWTYETYDPQTNSIGFKTFSLVNQGLSLGRCAFKILPGITQTSELLDVEGYGTSFSFFDIKLLDFQLNYLVSGSDFTTKWKGKCNDTDIETAIFTVDSSGFDIVSGDTLNYYIFNASNTGISTEDMKIKIYSHIGPAYGGPKIPFGNAHCNDDLILTKLRCFDDGYYHYNFVDYPCDSTWQLSTTIEKDFQNHISIYPNPTQNTLNIKGLPQGKYSYKILNTQGVKVLEGKLNNENINSSSLENGMYFLQLWNDKGVVFVDRFIKME
jgi:hypothetical protein